jgi:hypothetical protein
MLDRSNERPTARLADTPTFRSIVTTVAFATLVPALLPFLYLMGFDTGTSLGLRPLVHWVLAIAVIPLVAMPVWFWWFLPRGDLSSVPHWNLKHDSPGTWLGSGVATGLFAAGCALVCAELIAGALVQNLDGTQQSLNATVTEVETRHGRRRICDIYATFKEEWSHDTFKVCVIPHYGSAVTQDPLAAGDRVQVVITSNVLGWAVKRVAIASRDSAA